ncbi:MAG TPA: GatB/YqeY domain-containing protein [Candidatus Omnitrophota bacterium]|nr:GatB/YqeY domain-containing protein [Candidatus Omnitrophota bacterium]HPD84946.1 GatB/YqeY domain-containing protein [Candidatus Omnitrophota bacterium]HRZ03804.1 GatB/YqeY domain-containing protein [Candidatus Omnitrophota bacterium]
MLLEERIAADYKEAMKSKEAAKVSALSFLRAQLKYAAIEKKAEKLADADVVTVVKKQVKQRQDSIAQFEKGGRSDLVEKEKTELAILKSYLPSEMSEGELKTIVEAAVKEAGATGIKDMGKVMKVILSQVAGKADNTMVSNLVKEALSKM